MISVLDVPITYCCLADHPKKPSGLSNHNHLSSSQNCSLSQAHRGGSSLIQGTRLGNSTRGWEIELQDGPLTWLWALAVIWELSSCCGLGPSLSPRAVSADSFWVSPQHSAWLQEQVSEGKKQRKCVVSGWPTLGSNRASFQLYCLRVTKFHPGPKGRQGIQLWKG